MRALVLGATTAGLLLAGGIAPGADRPPQEPRLSADYAKRRDQVLPSPGELSYRKIAWRTSVLHGLVDAQTGDKPLLLVLMNGHPLGCT